VPVTTIRGIEGFKALVGQSLGPSEWLAVDQRRVNDFAQSTGDMQWIHVDARRAAKSAFGTTVAHGFLTLSLIPQFWHSAARIQGFTSAVFYGLDRVRFSAPVLIPSRLRAAFKIQDVAHVPGGIRVKLLATLERESEVKPVCVAEMLVLHYL
jgi:acyl dehydratase